MSTAIPAADRAAVLAFIAAFDTEESWRRAGLDPVIHPLGWVGRPVAAVTIEAKFGRTAGRKQIEALEAEGLIERQGISPARKGFVLTSAGRQCESHER